MTNAKLLSIFMCLEVIRLCVPHIDNFTMEMDSNFKKKRVPVGKGGGILSIPYATDPMLIIYPLNLKGYMISMGTAAYGW